MSGFSEAEDRWIDQLGGLRNVIRQELIGRQLGGHVGATDTVLDVGCGQGTQALRLAARGCRVTGLDPSPTLLARFSADALAAAVTVELLEEQVGNLDRALKDRVFDVVCAHGLLMYVEDRAATIGQLARRVSPGGRLSITFRNGHALAFRPGMRRRWADALAAFDERTYRNELGVLATADRLEEVEADLKAAGCTVLNWFGVRVFNDAVDADTSVPTDDDLALLLDAEDQAGRNDPYRWMASQLHVIATRGPD